MISKGAIQYSLGSFLNKRKVLIKKQDVDDIINGILETHELYKEDYNKICHYFNDKDIESICQKIFTFLKQNVPYEVESNEYQTLRSPNAILNLKSADCKSYALFSCGIIDALIRKHNLKCNLYYRFASYDMFNDVPEHVFCVVKVGGKEIWLDNVLKFLDERKEPYFWEDYKINNMALVGISGIDTENENGLAAVGLDPVSAIFGAFTSIASLFQGKQATPQEIANEIVFRQGKGGDSIRIDAVMTIKGIIQQGKSLYAWLNTIPNIQQYFVQNRIDEISFLENSLKSWENTREVDMILAFNGNRKSDFINEYKEYINKVKQQVQQQIKAAGSGSVLNNLTSGGNTKIFFLVGIGIVLYLTLKKK